MATNSTEIFRVGSIALFELKDDSYPRPPWLIVMDDRPSFRVRFYTEGPAALSVGFDSALNESDSCIHGIADYTSNDDGSGPRVCAVGEVQISDTGLLSALARQRALHDIRIGWTAQLPVQAVEVVRRAIAITEARALGEPIAA